MLTRFVSGLLAAAVFGIAAHAQQFSDVVQLDVLDGGTGPDGTHIAALHLTLKPGWKTYWRSPGDAGIPPEFTWRGSRNLDAVDIAWPSPKAFDQDGYRSIGYEDQLVLPLTLTPARPGQTIRLKGVMDLGICREVCIPERLRFEIKLDPAADRSPLIVAALADQPYSESEAGVTSATCRIAPSARGMMLEAHITMPSAGGTEIAVIEAGNPAIWSSEAKTTRHGRTLIAKSELIHQGGGAVAIDRSQVRVTVLGRNYAVDIQGCTPA